MNGPECRQMPEVACGHVFALRAAVSVDGMFYTCHSNVLLVHHPVRALEHLLIYHLPAGPSSPPDISRGCRIH